MSAPTIEDTLKQLCDEGCCLVVTTGGTGPALRDITPEATEAVCDKLMPGFGELMRKVSLEKCRPPFSHDRPPASAAKR